VRAVAPGPYHVGHCRAVDGQGDDAVHEGVEHAAEFRCGLAFGAQRGQECRELRRLVGVVHDLGHRPAGVIRGQVLTGQQRDGERLWAVEAGHPELARHGSGDVLAGMTAGLVAQALPGPDAAVLACYLVGTAGSALARDTGPGWLSRELLDAAGAALRDLLAEPAPARPPARVADSGPLT
jgi:Carbohydrate kinase